MGARSKSAANRKLVSKRAPEDRASARAAYESGAFALALSPAGERDAFAGLERLDREELDDDDDDEPMTRSSR